MASHMLVAAKFVVGPAGGRPAMPMDADEASGGEALAANPP